MAKCGAAEVTEPVRSAPCVYPVRVADEGRRPAASGTDSVVMGPSSDRTADPGCPPRRRWRRSHCPREYGHLPSAGRSVETTGARLYAGGPVSSAMSFRLRGMGGGATPSTSGSSRRVCGRPFERCPSLYRPMPSEDQVSFAGAPGRSSLMLRAAQSSSAARTERRSCDGRGAFARPGPRGAVVCIGKAWAL